MDAPADATDAAVPPSPTGEPARPLDLDALALELAEVETALERLDDGTYGRCAACDATIDDEILAADPTARTCAAHLPV